jgi:hypothetical protein
MSGPKTLERHDSSGPAIHILKVFLLSVVFLIVASPLFAGDLSLTWDANTEPDLDGYKLHYGQASRSYTQSVDVGDQTTYTLTGLEDGVTWYLAVTAYDLYDNESDYSNEVSHHFPVLVSVSVTGPAEVDEDGGAQYTCTATYSDGSTSDVTASAIWSEDSPYADINVSGYLTTLAVDSDQPCGLTADYTYNGVNRSDSLNVTIKDVPPTLVAVAVNGPVELDEEGGAQYTCTATYSDSSTADVTTSAVWSEDSPFADINVSGYLTTLAVGSDQLCGVTADYTDNGVTRNDTLDVTIKNVPPDLVSIAVTGPVQVDDEGGAQYNCTATWSDGSTSDVTAATVWSEDSDHATITSNGYLTTLPVIGDQPCRISAVYTAGGESANSSLDITIRDTGDDLAPEAPDNFRLAN